MLKRSVYVILTITWMITIYSFSARTAEVSGSDSMFITDYVVNFFFDNPSSQTINLIETVIRKLAHFSEFAVLSILISISFRSFGFSAKAASASILLGFLYAVSDEIHQYFVPGRACRMFDILVDTLGASLGYLIFFVSYKIRIRTFERGKLSR